MKHYVNQFLAEGNAYRAKQYDFLLLKDLITFVRKEDLSVKFSEIKEALIELGWKHKKASVQTDAGYKSKDIWYSDERQVNTRDLPITSKTRKTLETLEVVHANNALAHIFTNLVSLPILPEVFYEQEELIYTNKGIKTLLTYIGATGSIPKLASIIRNSSTKILIGERFLGTNSSTVLFKNYYSIKRPEKLTDAELLNYKFIK